MLGSRIARIVAMGAIALALGIAPPASAHEPDTFTVCGAYSRTSPRCFQTVDISAGHIVYVRGRISGHRGRVDVMLGGPPHRIASARIQPGGIIRFAWVAPADRIGQASVIWLRKPNHGETYGSLLVHIFGAA